MNARSCLRRLAVAAVSILSVSAEAVTLPSCGIEVLHPEPLAVTDQEPVVLTLRGGVDYCSTVRVAAVGEAAILGLPQPTGALNIIIAHRPMPLPPGESCPAVVVPFEMEVRLPEKLPAVPVPGVFPIGVYLRFEDRFGNAESPRACGILDLTVAEGHRSAVPFHEGRFTASVTWRTADRNGLGYEVPGDTTQADSSLFWFFQPANWELMVKVLDGCAINQHYWVLGAAATDVLYSLRITDAGTGTVWERTSPGGQLSPAFADVEAFPCD